MCFVPVLFGSFDPLEFPVKEYTFEDHATDKISDCYDDNNDLSVLLFELTDQEEDLEENLKIARKALEQVDLVRFDIQTYINFLTTKE